MLTSVSLILLLLQDAQEMTQLSKLMQLDKNQDGYVTLTEAVADTRVLRYFALIDDNADARLSHHEWMNSAITKQLGNDQQAAEHAAIRTALPATEEQRAKRRGH